MVQNKSTSKHDPCDSLKKPIKFNARKSEKNFDGGYNITHIKNTLAIFGEKLEIDLTNPNIRGAKRVSELNSIRVQTRLE